MALTETGLKIWIGGVDATAGAVGSTTPIEVTALGLTVGDAMGAEGDTGEVGGPDERTAVGLGESLCAARVEP